MSEEEMQPGGPLCGCDACEGVRRDYGVEYLTPDLLAESARRQTVVT